MVDSSSGRAGAVVRRAARRARYAAARARGHERAPAYAVGLGPSEQVRCGTLMDALSGQHFDRALEVGCGDGALTPRLAAHADALVGVDRDATALAGAARRAPAATFERRDLPGDLPGGTFDLIVCADTLQDWDPAGLGDHVGTLLDMLRPGGLLLAYHRRAECSRDGERAADRVHDELHATALGRGMETPVRQDRADARFDVVRRPADRAPLRPSAVPSPRTAPADQPTGARRR
ncbi:methyltransferase domain-containing protein [Pseudonocardia phyllosphaerae]|uniref:methyltransferase domain-containing protein n=1 Tax=Pseudonocardia phyllosphaerae TaxID=3390502 RepID=UPI003979481D